MTIVAMKDLYEAKPFQPFILNLSDGRTVPVHHREFIAAVPSGSTLVVIQPDDRIQIIDLIQVTGASIAPASKRRRKT